MPAVLLATCAALPAGDPDDHHLAAALTDRGFDVAWAPWDDPEVDWDEAPLVVLRSTWDYAERRGEFLAWVEGLPRVRNAADVVRWNTDKRYLAELAAAGVPVVPTAYVAPGEPLEPPPGEYVVKPAVSAGARDTARHGPGDEEAAHAHVARLHAAGRTAMVQPYVASVDADGETALLHLGGAFSHAIRKGPLLRRGAGPVDGLYAEEEIAPRTPSDAERAVADAALDAIPFPRDELLYARVDLVATADGPRVLELELSEPSLFLGHAPGAAARLAGFIATAVDDG